MNRNIFCTDCGCERSSEEGVCPNCGSKATTVKMVFTDTISFDETIKGKEKASGVKRPIKEFKYGADFNRDWQKMVDRTMIIDRAQNQYYEKVVDRQTSEVIHECSESLTDHYGHGTAKNKDK